MIDFAKGIRRISFKYKLLNENDNPIGQVDDIESATIEHGEFRNIKRSAVFKFSKKPTRDINFQRERIQPFMVIKENNTVIEEPLGIFILDTPNEAFNTTSVVFDVTSRDKLAILADMPITRPYVVKANTNYVGAISKLLNEAGITKIDIQSTERVLDRDVPFPTGTKYKVAITQLLNEINYYTLSVNENGFAYSSEYVEPYLRPITKKYFADGTSILFPDFKKESGLSGRANVFIGEALNLESGIVIPPVIIRNNSPDSPTSIVNTGREIADDNYTFDDVPDYQTLANRMLRIATDNSTGYAKLTFNTALTKHGGNEVINFYEPKVFPTPVLFFETSWRMNLMVGGQMSHECRRVIRL